MAGAVDLSGLKQRAQAAPPRSEVRCSPRCRRHRGHRGQLRGRGAGPVRTGTRRGGAVVAAQRRLACSWPKPGGAGRRRQGHVGLGDRQRRRHAPGGAGVRRAGRPDRGGAGRRSAAGQFPGHATAGSAAQLGRFAAGGNRGQARRRRAEDGDEPEQVDPALAQARDHLDAGDFDAAKAGLRGDPDRRPQPRRSQGRRAADRLPVACHRAAPDAVAVADAAPADIEAAFAAADVAVAQPGRRRARSTG